MTRITMDEAAKRTLGDAVQEAIANQQTIVVTGPQGEVARIVPAAVHSPQIGERRWKGRPVHDAEDLACMSPDELRSIGWTLPDESAWVDEIANPPDQGQKPCR